MTLRTWLYGTEWTDGTLHRMGAWTVDVTTLSALVGITQTGAPQRAGHEREEAASPATISDGVLRRDITLDEVLKKHPYELRDLTISASGRSIDLGERGLTVTTTHPDDAYVNAVREQLRETAHPRPSRPRLASLALLALPLAAAVALIIAAVQGVPALGALTLVVLTLVAAGVAALDIVRVAERTASQLVTRHCRVVPLQWRDIIARRITVLSTTGGTVLGAILGAVATIALGQPG